MVKVLCEQCGKEFNKKPFRFKRDSKHFCNIECLKIFRKNKSKNTIILHNDFAEVICTNGIALIDIDDIQIIEPYHWYFSEYGYVHSYITSPYKKRIHMHRLIKNCPDGKVVDHINHNRNDNRKCNLRICSQFENMQNQKHNKNKSGKVGVFKCSKSSSWIATFKSKVIGRYKTFEQAKYARIEKEKENKNGTYAI